MALRVARGLFRLWLILSVIWVIFIVISGWDQLSEIFTAIEPPPGQGGVVLPPGLYECWATRNADNPFVIIHPGVETSADMSLTTAWRRCITYKLQIPIKALTPPLMLLALGSALIWAFRGFRSDFSVRQRLPTKIYLDNNIVSAIAKDDEPSESDALDRLLTAWRTGKVDLVTSELTLAEIKRYHDPRMRAAIERIFRFLEKVEIVRWDELVGIHSYGDARTWINTPMIQNYPEYGALLTLGLEAADAQHVYVAGKQACDTFLTCDKGILRRAAGIKGIFSSLTVQEPSQLV